MDHGMIDMIVPREELRDRLSELLALYQLAETASHAPRAEMIGVGRE